MKTFMILLALMIGLSSTCAAQAKWKQGTENTKAKKNKEPRKQMSHFDKKKKDPAMKFNGTSASLAYKKSKYKVDGNGFKSPKYFTDSQKTKGKKSKNKNFNTYTYK